ncbi:MAG: 50S ribosomal protein L5 [Candidatus Peribacteraceae bacterium]|jgi:large subunit ribosomal protein L5
MKYESLHHRLRGPIAKTLQKELGVDNIHALPRMEKVIVNVGINKTKMDSKELHQYIGETLALITGQKPVFRKTRKAISNFKTREGTTVGAMVTLRGAKMEEFLDRLLSYVLPRIRDFRGLPTKLDGHGNYAIGLKDHTIFPEVPSVEAGRIFGLQIQLSTTAKNDEEGRALLKALGMPFQPTSAPRGHSESTAGGREQKKDSTGSSASDISS